MNTIENLLYCKRCGIIVSTTEDKETCKVCGSGMSSIGLAEYVAEGNDESAAAEY